MMLLRICLPFTYLVCSSNTRVGRRGLSMFAITFEIILYTTLHNAMGLNLSGVMAFSCFRSRAMKEVLSTFRIVLFFLESSTTSRISCLAISHHALKKSTLRPSDPRSFPFCISLMTSLIPSSFTDLLRLYLSSLVICLGMYFVNSFMN